MSFRITQYNIQNILMNNIFRLLLIVTALFTNNHKDIYKMKTSSK